MTRTHEATVEEAIKTALPAVVSIVIAKDEKEVAREISEENWKDIEKIAAEEKAPATRKEIMSHLPRTEDGKVRVGWGSGFFVSPNGHVLTNKHVVVDAEAEYIVKTVSEDTHTAKVLARDPLNDVAVLKIEGKDFPTIRFGDSNKIQLGQTVIALGNALGEFQNTVSAGIISGLSRFLTNVLDSAGESEHLRGLIQTDAAINPGNSGGPLINLHGEVIGINVATVFGAENISFAIPINRAKRDIADVFKFGRIRKPMLGIRYVPVTAELQKKLKLPVSHGLLVHGERVPGYQGVLKHSPAEKAGIQDGDIILAVNGAVLSETETLEDILENSEIGSTLTLQVLQKDGKKTDTGVVLEERK
ncbi:MAG: trypsin-like peptidase domain-containing protein [Candidatus Sungbacteria bacterium]|uniref:Trypsin-like peptidase domain-containing protein n=1 Tax=Candidatus Sungiibacteriota bacterium TaxID=2750080 RepID=A0A931WPT0_9BACT|nr:trypsin-like peptidase domain-containing protein [Candidatus Sungbacteria bacterium]